MAMTSSERQQAFKKRRADRTARMEQVLRHIDAGLSESVKPWAIAWRKLIAEALA